MSTRMGQDKGLTTIDNKPMIIHVIETVTLVADEILLVLRDNNQVDKYEKILNEIILPENKKIKVITDILKDQGPLGGILSGLNHISNKALVLPCDSPYITKTFVNMMFKLSEDMKYDAVVPKWHDGRLEPLHSIYKKSVRANIKKLLSEDVHDVKSLLSQLNVRYVDAKSIDKTGKTFLNINRMDDIQ